MQRIVVVGAGFAGLWSAVGAARRLDELGVGPSGVEIVVLNRTPWHSIRVRNYEAALEETLVPLGDVLGPVGVKLLVGDVQHIDVASRRISWRNGEERSSLTYDRLVLAPGSCLHLPPVPGLDSFAFDIDTFEGAERLRDHLAALPGLPSKPGRATVVIVGGGLTGVELACEMPARLRAALPGSDARVVIVDHRGHIGSDMGEGACACIAEALCAAGVETRTSAEVASIDADGATFASGEPIAAATVVWCAGMRASPLTAEIGVGRDCLGRLTVDTYLRVTGAPGVFAAGDAARLAIDDTHSSVMSCQHARPMGRYVGYNVVGDLLGEPMLPLHVDDYVTVLDLGAWGAVYTVGWSRQVIATGAAAKRTKETINRQRIYPPRSRDRREILDAAAPVVQARPAPPTVRS